MTSAITLARPFADTYKAYRILGYHPIPARGKTPLAKNYQHAAEWTDSDYERMANANAYDNIGIEPHGFIVLDVDAASEHKRDGADGVTALKQLEAQLGPLPTTWTSTARGPKSASRHYLYRIPAEYHGFDMSSGKPRPWFRNPAPGIDMICEGLRYILVSPSVHPTTGKTYEWYNQWGDVSRAPEISELPMLPEAWIRHCLRSAQRQQTTATTTTVVESGMCKGVTTALGKYLIDPVLKGSRHDTARDTVHKLALMSTEGHKGAIEAINKVRETFLTAVADTRTSDEAMAEFDRMTSEETILADTGIADPCTTYTPARQTSQDADSKPLKQRKPKRRAELTPASKISKKAPRFLDNPMIPTGVITLCAGRAGESKSTFCLYRASLATKGQLEGDWKGTPCNVVISGIEDSQSMQRMRLEAAGADLDRVMFLTMDGHSGVSIPDDLDTLKPLFRERDIRMWMIDPITSAMDGDSNKRDDVRRALDPLAQFAEELDIAIVGILHFNKGGGYASDKISGSHAFRDVIRSLLLIAKDADNGDCVLTIDKSSYTTAQNTSYSYALHGVDIADDDGKTFSVPTVSGFMPTDRTVGDVINKNMTMDAPTERAEKGEVIQWLTDFLQDGPAPFEEIRKAAKEEGYTPKQLSHARDRASDPWIVSERDPTYEGRGQRRLWMISQTNPDENTQQ
ncbi:AAA family ATPase [Bifidobacterium callimiconis]|uniref:AAA family ATPase n=1 Tax=Bifidobacterium callimiconis TaxID=2306973 RepID=UPI001BDC49A2|nr:AAA family ATPase [Bifidobacterium callimiconis]MBT1176996.1 AAA family ATPase [Bifidobacterium callimiconis]